MNPDSLKKRYFYKLGANLINVPLSMVIMALVPRTLGPVDYGNFTFLTQFFAKVTSFFDSGSSIGFYTKLSQRLLEKRLIKFYWCFVLGASILVSITVPLVFLLNKQELLWPSQDIKYIWMALFFSLLTWDSQIVSKIVDAYGLTVKGEVITLVRKILGLALILALFLIGILDLKTFFYYNYFVLFIFITGSRKILKKNGISLFPQIKLGFSHVKNYIKEFWIYSHPLLTSSALVLFTGILDVWLLQKFAGSVQQGFYGLALRISGVFFLFASSMTPLITREFSIAFGNKDIIRMRQLFVRYIPMFYSIVTFFAIFLGVNANTVSLIFGGAAFKQASIPVLIMALYPMHQTYGQLSGSVFYATGQTKIYRNIGIFNQCLGIVAVFLLIAPKIYYGLNLGATGLALKMISIQFIGVNIQLFYNAKFLKISFLKYFSHQVYTILIFGTIAYLSLLAANIVTDSIIISLVLNGTFYVILSTCLLFLFPIIFSLSKSELKDYIIIVKNKNPLLRKKH